MENNNTYIFVDLDGVIVTSRQHLSKKLHPKYMSNPFDKKCVNVFNEICDTTTPIIILSSDWKLHYNLDELNEIFRDNGMNCIITDVTTCLWGTMFTNFSQLEECRAAEIMQYVKEHNIINFMAIDDLNLSKWIPDRFVHCTRSFEGIKQSGIKEKIINILK